MLIVMAGGLLGFGAALVAYLALDLGLLVALALWMGSGPLAALVALALAMGRLDAGAPATRPPRRQAA